MKTPVLSDRESGIAAASLLLGAVTAWWLTKSVDHARIDWHVTAEVAAHIATAVGVVIAGCWAWYLTRRRRSLEPRVELIHRYQTWQDSDGSVLRLSVELRNPSEALLSPGDGMTYVQVPPINALNSAEYVYDVWTDIAKIRHASTYESIRVEPKESEIFSHDVRLPPNIRFVQLYTVLACKPGEQKYAADDQRPIDEIEIPEDDETWHTITLIDLKEPTSPALSSTLSVAP
jgi:hypothetical protein